MPLLNLSFEDAGIGGLPDQWSFTVVNSLQEWASWSGTTWSSERFELGWQNNNFQSAFGVGDTEASTYLLTSNVPRVPRESFEKGWDNDQFLSALSLAEEAVFSLLGAEAFEADWDNDNFVWAFTNPLVEASEFDVGTPQTVEDFEEEWENDSFKWAFSGGDTTAATWNETIQTYENFEPAYEPIGVLINPTTDTLYATAHGLTAGLIVMVQSTGTLPSGLDPEAYYYVVAPSSDAFQLSMSSGGAAVDLASAGTGHVTVVRDPRGCWNTFLS